MLGNCYFYGAGVEVDFEKAVYWYNQAAKHGDCIAKQMLADCYYFGIGVERDVSKAFERYYHAVLTIQTYGDFYYFGLGVPVDKIKAFEAYKAAAPYDVRAQRTLGNCYYYGHGTKRNVEEAIHWYRKAAMHRDNYSLEMVNLYYTAHGGEESEKWFEAAAKIGGDQYGYGKNPAIAGRDLSYEMPDYEAVAKDMSSRKNMTLVVLWNRYAKKCRDCGLKFYSYRQFCENYAKWCEENKETLHFNAVIDQKMEVDFTGKTFQMVDPLTGEVWRDHPKFCVNLRCGASILHHIGGLHKIWDGLIYVGMGDLVLLSDAFCISCSPEADSQNSGKNQETDCGSPCSTAAD